jgi:hypothetical protein
MRLRTMFVLALLTTVGGGSARAGLLPVNVTVTPDAGQYRWTYAIVLPTDSQINAGDYFTIYDFAGLVSGTNSQPTDWVFSESNVGPVPAGVVPTDSAAIPNLTWTYSGPTIPTGQLGLGNFWAISAYSESTDASFTARTHRTSDGRIDTNITDTVVPVPTATPPGVPEPGTLVLAALGVPFLGLVRRSRRRG